MRTTSIGSVALLALSASVSQTAHATPLFEEMGGFGGQSVLQARHTGASAAAAYFNPALLPDAPVGLTAGVAVINTEIGISLRTRPDSANVPNEVNSYSTPDGRERTTYPFGTLARRDGVRNALTGEYSLPPQPRQSAGTGHQTYTYEAIGLVLKLFEDRVAFGLYTLLPNRSFTKFDSHFANEKDQYGTNSLHPELYGDRLTAVSVASALGLRITKSLNLGLGATIGLKAVADASAFVANASHLENIDLNIKAKAIVNVVPHLGVAWKPIKRLHLTGTVHAPQQLQLKAGFTFSLASGSQQGSTLAFTYDFQPWQVGGGASYDIIQRKDLNVTATGSLLYARWSQYIDRQSIRPYGAYEWQDTLSGALGMRVDAGDIGIGLDGMYKPTPVPQQTGRYNYVDMDRLGLGLAVDYAFKAMGQKMKLGMQLQGALLLERHTTKLPTPTFADGVNRTPQLVTDEVPDNSVTQSKKPAPGRDGLQTNNPGWPGFDSVGWVSSASLYLTVIL